MIEQITAAMLREAFGNKWFTLTKVVARFGGQVLPNVACEASRGVNRHHRTVPDHERADSKRRLEPVSQEEKLSGVRAMARNVVLGMVSRQCAERRPCKEENDDDKWEYRIKPKKPGGRKKKG